MYGLEPADIYYETTDTKPRPSVMHEEMSDSLQENLRFLDASPQVALCFLFH